MQMNKFYKASENKNYFKWMFFPNNFYSSVKALFSSFSFAVGRRLAPNYLMFLNMPRNVRRKRKGLIRNQSAIKQLGPSIDACDCAHINLELTSGPYLFEGPSSWEHSFDDSEVTISLHRWGWLLLGLTSGDGELTRDLGLCLMRSWIKHCGSNKEYSRDAYSVSERIVNGTIFLLHTGDKSIPLDLQDAFYNMGIEIAEHLEYYEGDRTGNHAFNNARGLFFSGVIGKCPEAIALAMEIILERFPRLITSDGFLREASSHYHFLFTRWVLEMYWLAGKFNLAYITSLLEPYANKLLKCCWFFLVRDDDTGEWTIPLVGDISPDFPPDWLLSIPWATLSLDLYKPGRLPKYMGKKGWGGIFKLNEGGDDQHIVESQYLPDSFWYKAVFGSSIIFLFAESFDGALRADHRHLDLGGFVFYSSGKQILIDCGRADYTNSSIGAYGKSAAAHNTLFINDLPPSSLAPSWFSRGYKGVKVCVEILATSNGVTVILRHNGFNRLFLNSIFHERWLILESNSFKVEDKVFGNGRCKLGLRFHWAPHLRLSAISPNKFLVNPALNSIFKVDDRLDKTLIFGRNEDMIAGVCSFQYGALLDCCTLALEANIKLPIVVSNNLSWE